MNTHYWFPSTLTPRLLKALEGRNFMSLRLSYTVHEDDGKSMLEIHFPHMMNDTDERRSTARKMLIHFVMGFEAGCKDERGEKTNQTGTVASKPRTALEKNRFMIFVLADGGHFINGGISDVLRIVGKNVDIAAALAKLGYGEHICLPGDFIVARSAGPSVDIETLRMRTALPATS